MVAETLDRQVRQRARDRCEYCRIPVHAYIVPFQIDHVIAIQHGGSTELGNLALACFHCNLHKGPNIASIDPASKQLVRLFHPRQDLWAEHFAWEGAELVGLSAIGRATIPLLAMNDPDAVAVRAALIVEGEDFRKPL